MFLSLERTDRTPSCMKMRRRRKQEGFFRRRGGPLYHERFGAHVVSRLRTQRSKEMDGMRAGLLACGLVPRAFPSFHGSDPSDSWEALSVTVPGGRTGITCSIKLVQAPVSEKKYTREIACQAEPW